MQALTLSITFLTFLVATTAIRLWLSTRQIRHVAQHRATVPAQFAERVGTAAHQRAASYTIARTRLGMLDILLGAAVTVGLTVLGGIAELREYWLAWLPGHPLLNQMLLVVSVILLTSLINLPLDLWRQFRLEARYGFNRMTWRLYFADLLKGTLLGGLIGLPLLAAVLMLMESAGAWWWFWVWLVWAGFNLVILVVYPIWIAPLFNRFEPLPEGTVRSRVEALLARCGFASNGLFVMDGSKRSAHGNAYFTGFGRGKRIVLFDTLLARLNTDEVEAVLAHELGHFRKRHITRRLLMSFAASLLGLALLGYLSSQPWFYQGLGVTVDLRGHEPRSAVALLLFLVALPVFTFALQPLFTRLSRRDEFEADAYAAEQSSPAWLSSALVKLYEDNAATLTPDPLHSAVYDSHPPAAQRIARLAAHPITPATMRAVGGSR